MKNIEQSINDYFNLVIDTLNSINKRDIIKFIELILEVYNNDRIR